MNSDELREIDCDDCCQEVRWKAADEIDRLSTENSELADTVLLHDEVIRTLTAEGRKCREHLRRLVDGYFLDTGAEPSVSVHGRAAYEAQEYLDSTASGRQSADQIQEDSK